MFVETYEKGGKEERLGDKSRENTIRNSLILGEENNFFILQRGMFDCWNEFQSERRFISHAVFPRISWKQDRGYYKTEYVNHNLLSSSRLRIYISGFWPGNHLKSIRYIDAPLTFDEIDLDTLNSIGRG